MPDRSQRDRLLDILDKAKVIADALDGVSLETFAADPILQRAVLHALQTIGEAAKWRTAQEEASAFAAQIRVSGLA